MAECAFQAKFTLAYIVRVGFRLPSSIYGFDCEVLPGQLLQVDERMPMREDHVPMVALMDDRRAIPIGTMFSTINEFQQHMLGPYSLESIHSRLWFTRVDAQPALSTIDLFHKNRKICVPQDKCPSTIADVLCGRAAVCIEEQGTLAVVYPLPSTQCMRRAQQPVPPPRKAA